VLSTTGITMQFASRKLFDDIHLTLHQGKRYGLIGANGAGKSTFLRILSGELEPTSGHVSLDERYRLGVLKQDQYAFEESTLADTVLYGNQRLFDAIKEKEHLYAEGDLSDESVNIRLGELEMICAEEDPTYEYEVNIEKILESLGFPSHQHHDLMSTLTGGDKFKILLAQVLFPKPDVLLLDEPTNNLDIHAIGWLESELRRHAGTMVVISHDRHFLNAVCTHILDMDFQKVREFTGTYDDWYIAANVIAKQQEMEYQKKAKEKEELEKFIARFSANASKAKQATSRQKQLEKLNIQEIKLSSRRDPSIVFKPNRDIGNEVLRLDSVCFGYDKPIYSDFSLTIKPKDKIALIGSNGIGKTTLLKLMMEELTPKKGDVAWGVTIQRGYFPQNATEVVQGEETLYEWLRQFDRKADTSTIRNNLGRMLFSGEDQEKCVNALSGGEKHRMLLSRLMMEQPNCLILDEPNNHLDLETIIALGESLHAFTGAIVCVTHDRELIDSFANRIIEITPDQKILDFSGTYEAYLESKGVDH
jgi:ATPase subunit of ABC transporter with duplicated ATPase domains